MPDFRFTANLSPVSGRRKKEKQQVFYTIQTNGMTLDDQWISFFKEENFLLGVSLDGVRKSHDETGWITREGLFAGI